jgi:hypothetical protein
MKEPDVWRCGNCGRIEAKYSVKPDGSVVIEIKCKCNQVNTLTVQPTSPIEDRGKLTPTTE